MDARAIIARVRDRQSVADADMRWFAAGLASGDVTDAQAGAFAMAVLLNGLGTDGRVSLTRAMRDSGSVLEWDLPGPVIDKHSTGGIGDAVSLLLAPALAACGACVPMISGRGLGHTGGTLDKLESIPGYRCDIDIAGLHRLVAGVGCAIVGASAEIAPADRRLYAVRDISGTVESIDLITASILSKKLAAGLEGLVLDVKVGSGAFMKTMEDALDLARSLVETAQGAGCMTTALITDMSQPLATSAGNALEVIEVMEVLTGAMTDCPLRDVTLALGGEALALGGLVRDAGEGAERIDQALSTGRAAEAFGRMVAELGGPGDFVERYPDRLPASTVVHEVKLSGSGYVRAIDTEALGQAVVHLGGGRLRETDKINHAVGLSEIVRIGEHVDPQLPVALIHAASRDNAERAAESVRAAFALSDAPTTAPDLIHERIA